MRSDLSLLCGSCGLCCDGSLFGRVPLREREEGPARRGGLRVLDDGRAFDQPCPALSSGARRACSVYGERPAACRAFACRLYDRHLRQGGPLGPRLEAVDRVRRLLADHESRGLSSGERDELERRIEADFARA
jgi:Fe-S-cluster containining protein